MTVTMTEMRFAPAKVTLKAGTTVEIKLVNKGRVKHEFMVYTTPKAGLAGEELEEWAEDNSYFKGLAVKGLVDQFISMSVVFARHVMEADGANAIG